MLIAEKKYHCADCLCTEDIIQCFDGYLTYDLCLDCMLEREEEYKDYKREELSKNLRQGDYE